MANKHIAQPHQIQSDIPDNIIGVKDVNFPGDPEGNRLALIEAEVKEIDKRDK